MYKLNRNIFKASTFEESESGHAEYYRKIDWKERFRITLYLNSIAFKMVGQKIKMDKSLFKATSRE
jgi:hypothetical protein